MNSPLIFATTYTRLLARELQLDVHTVAPLLAGTSLSPQQVFQLDEHLSLPDQVTIIRNALRISGDPALGLRMGSKLHLAAHGPVGVAAYSSATLGEAIDVMVRHQNIRGQFAGMEIERDATSLRVVFNLRVPYDEVGLFLIEALVASAQGSVSFLVGDDVDGSRIELGYPAPAHAAVYGQYLYAPFRFDAPRTLLTMSRAQEKTPLPFADPIAKQQAERQCEQIAVELKQRGSFASRVTGILRNNPGQLWTLDDVAASLHLSARTLIRRLKDEGTSYQHLLDEEQQRMARVYLENPRHTVESVAAALGYHDVSTFRRAFKRWFGVPPSEYLANRHDAGH
ncbi:MAG: AraC family transcriptional regulator [Gammaproteobacteria bacterium]